MSFQFVHLEAYSRKQDKGGRSVAWVLDEASRTPGSCPHVENPQPPVIVYGCSIEQLRSVHDEAVSAIKYAIAGGKLRGVRNDQKTLLTVVASHEFTLQDVAGCPLKRREYEAWEKDTVAWLQGQYGDSLKTIIRHEDEGRMHVHAYVLPGDLRALELHPGVAAKRQAKAQAEAQGLDGKAANKEGDQAYKKAMRAWQDYYHYNVGQKHGLARLGPGKRRLSRKEWQAEKSAARALQITSQRAAKVEKAAAAARAEIERLRVQAAKDAETAKHMRDAALAAEQRAKRLLSRARKEAARIVAHGRQRAEKLGSIGSLFRGLWDGLRKSALRQEIASSYEGKVGAALEEARNAKQEMYQVRRDLMEVRKRESEIRNSLAVLGQERDKLRLQLSQSDLDDSVLDRSFRR